MVIGTSEEDNLCNEMSQDHVMVGQVCLQGSFNASKKASSEDQILSKAPCEECCVCT